MFFIELDGVKAVRAWFESKGGMRVCYDPSGTVSLLSYEGKRTAHVLGDGETFYAFWEEDCMDPPIKLVRAYSFEEAYEEFCDAMQGVDLSEFSDEERRALEENGDCPPDHSMNNNGDVIYSAIVNGCEVRLISVDIVASEFSER